MSLSRSKIYLDVIRFNWFNWLRSNRFLFGLLLPNLLALQPPHPRAQLQALRLLGRPIVVSCLGHKWSFIEKKDVRVELSADVPTLATHLPWAIPR